jgi:immunity protein 5 of polymorphic toxin system
MILPAHRDPRLITVRRGGTLSDADHRLLALWAAVCAEHVVHHFERVAHGDDRPHEAIAAARAWARGEMRMMDAKRLAGASNAAAREVDGAARLAALAAGQAAVVAHVAAHDLGAAAYAIRAARAAADPDHADAAASAECRWQRAQLPPEVRDLVIDDQARRNGICWGVFAP